MVNKDGKITAEMGVNKRNLAVVYERMEYITAAGRGIALHNLHHPSDNL